MRPASLNELYAILLARDFDPEDRSFFVGAGLPMARAAAVIANLTTHPDARIQIGLGYHNLAGGRSLPPIRRFVTDPRTLAAEAWMRQGQIFENMHEPDVVFIGALQIDRRANLNLFGIPDEDGGWKMRGPGGLALATLTAHARGCYVVMSRHDSRTFVERVALITAVGDRHERDRLKLPGGGIRLVLSPLGVFDFGEDGNMRARSLHAGVSPEVVSGATGFAMDVSAETPVTPNPTDQELRALRELIDLELEQDGP